MILRVARIILYGMHVVHAVNDGWNIDSIVTYVGAPGKGFRDATIDFNVFRWVDGNGAPSNTYFMLKKIH